MAPPLTQCFFLCGHLLLHAAVAAPCQSQALHPNAGMVGKRWGQWQWTVAKWFWWLPAWERPLKKRDLRICRGSGGTDMSAINSLFSLTPPSLGIGPALPDPGRPAVSGPTSRAIIGQRAAE